MDIDKDRTKRWARKEFLKLSLRKVRVTNTFNYIVGKANVYIHM